MSISLTIGSDPEIFVKDKAGSFKSAFGLIPGNKKAPHAVDKGAVQVDGMALEINTDPAANENEFVNNINTVMSKLRSMVPQDYELAVFPTAEFTTDVMKSQPYEALALGCDPDFNAYTQKQNPFPKAPFTMRCAGGHIHVGWTTDADPFEPIHFRSCCDLAKQLDYFVGLPSLYFDHDYKRRTMYGTAGSFRPKSYGMEYRVLSNFWIKSPDLMKFIFRQVTRAFNELALHHRSAGDAYGNFAKYQLNATQKKNIAWTDMSYVMKHLSCIAPESEQLFTQLKETYKDAE